MWICHLAYTLDLGERLDMPCCVFPVPPEFSVPFSCRSYVWTPFQTPVVGCLLSQITVLPVKSELG